MKHEEHQAELLAVQSKFINNLGLVYLNLRMNNVALMNLLYISYHTRSSNKFLFNTKGSV